MKVVIYARVSTKTQEFDRQVAELREYASKMEYEVVAEFTEKKDSVVSSWTAFELTKLGAVDCVDFELISTQPDVPAYFCMDSMFATISLEY